MPKLPRRLRKPKEGGDGLVYVLATFFGLGAMIGGASGLYEAGIEKGRRRQLEEEFKQKGEREL